MLLSELLFVKHVIVWTISGKSCCWET